MDRGSWQATVHRVAKSQTWLKWLSVHHSSWTLPFPQASACLLLPVTANSFLIHCRFICSWELSYCPHRWPHSTWHSEFVDLHFILLGPDYIYWCAAIHGAAKSWTRLSDWTDWLTIYLIEIKGCLFFLPSFLPSFLSFFLSFLLSFFLPFYPSSTSSSYLSSSFSFSSLYF